MKPTQEQLRAVNRALRALDGDDEPLGPDEVRETRVTFDDLALRAWDVIAPMVLEEAAKDLEAICERDQLMGLEPRSVIERIRALGKAVTLPEWVHHIKHPHLDQKGKAWCGESVEMQFYFTGADHAALTGLQRQRLQACPRCVDAVTEALKMSRYEP